MNNHKDFLVGVVLGGILGILIGILAMAVQEPEPKTVTKTVLLSDEVTRCEDANGKASLYPVSWTDPDRTEHEYYQMECNLKNGTLFEMVYE